MRISVDIVVQKQDSFHIIARREVNVSGVESPSEICGVADGTGKLVELALESIALKIERDQITSLLAASGGGASAGDES